jgi:ankyrin repeat protein
MAFYIQNLLHESTDANIFFSTPDGDVEHMGYVLLPYLYPSHGDLFDEKDREHVAKFEDLLLEILHYTALGETPAAKGPALVAAAGAGNWSKISELLAGGISVNEQDPTGITAIWSAARMGHKDVVEQLISSKADVNLAAISGYAPIHCAAHEGYAEIGQLLIDNGADIHLERKRGVTPKVVAQKYSNEEIWQTWSKKSQTTV